MMHSAVLKTEQQIDSDCPLKCILKCISQKISVVMDGFSFYTVSSRLDPLINEQTTKM